MILALSLASSAFAQDSRDWTEPFPAFHIAGNVYYVGSKGLANYLVTGPQGNTLINSDLESNVPMIEASIEKLGFKLTMHGFQRERLKNEHIQGAVDEVTRLGRHKN